MIRPELFKIHHHRTPWAGAVGIAVMAGALAVVAAVGMGLSWLAAERAGEALITEGIHRELAADGFMAVITGAVAYLLSIILRSDTYGMLMALAVMVVLGPLASLIPDRRQVHAVRSHERCGGRDHRQPWCRQPTHPHCDLTVLAATLGVLTIVAVQLFKTRDV